MKFPSLPQKDQPVADTIRDIINYLRSSRVTSVSGGRMKQGPNGTTIEIPKVRVPTVYAEPKKLTITGGSDVDKFRIVPGVVNAETPTLGGTAIDDAEPPEITVTADVWVWVKAVGTFGTPDTYVVTIETSASSTAPTGTEITSTGFVSFRNIGKVDFTSGTPDTYAITNYHSGGDMGVDSFGNINHWWIQ